MACLWLPWLGSEEYIIFPGQRPFAPPLGSLPSLTSEPEQSPCPHPLLLQHPGSIWRGSAAPAHCVTGSISHLPSPDERLGTQNRLLGKYGLPQGPERSLEDWLFSIINGMTYHFKCIFVDLRKHHKGKKNKQQTNKQNQLLVF